MRGGAVTSSWFGVGGSCWGVCVSNFVCDCAAGVPGAVSHCGKICHWGSDAHNKGMIKHATAARNHVMCFVAAEALRMLRLKALHFL